MIVDLNRKVSIAKNLNSGFISPHKLRSRVTSQSMLEDINSPRQNVEFKQTRYFVIILSLSVYFKQYLIDNL